MKIEMTAKRADKVVPGDLITYLDNQLHVVEKIEWNGRELLFHVYNGNRPLRAAKGKTILGGKARDGYKFAQCLRVGDFIIIQDPMEKPQALKVATFERIEGRKIRITIREYLRQFIFEVDEEVQIYTGTLVNRRPPYEFWRWC